MRQDSNLRTLLGTDLKSGAFDHFATHPYNNQLNLNILATGLEPATFGS